MTEHGTHILFVPGPAKPRTSTWSIFNRYENTKIGTISWFGRWRKYAFHPGNDTVFEEVCLREIAEFCERKTTEHCQKRAQEARNK